MRLKSALLVATCVAMTSITAHAETRFSDTGDQCTISNYLRGPNSIYINAHRKLGSSFQFRHDDWQLGSGTGEVYRDIILSAGGYITEKLNAIPSDDRISVLITKEEIFALIKASGPVSISRSDRVVAQFDVEGALDHLEEWKTCADRVIIPQERRNPFRN